MAFHADGNRAAVGLIYNLENLQGPVDAGDRHDAWYDLKMQDQVVLLGTYEESRGFERALDAAPYWKGGRMGWQAPANVSDETEAPDTWPTNVENVERMTVEEAAVEGKPQSASVLAAIIVPTVLGALFIACACWYGYCHCTRNKLDDELESFLHSLHELRHKLQVYHILTVDENTLFTRACRFQNIVSNSLNPPPPLFPPSLS